MLKERGLFYLPPSNPTWSMSISMELPELLTSRSKKNYWNDTFSVSVTVSVSVNVSSKKQKKQPNLNITFLLHQKISSTLWATYPALDFRYMECLLISGTQIFFATSSPWNMFFTLLGKRIPPTPPITNWLTPTNPLTEFSFYVKPSLTLRH